MTTPTGPADDEAKKAAANKAANKGCLWLVLTPLLLVGACGLFVFNGSDDDDSGSSSGAKSSSIVLCRDSVKKQLKSPSSAKFGWGNETVSVSSGTETNGTLTVSGVVDADNSFGASLRSSWICTATVVNGEAQRAVATLNEG